MRAKSRDEWIADLMNNLEGFSMRSIFHKDLEASWGSSAERALLSRWAQGRSQSGQLSTFFQNFRHVLGAIFCSFSRRVEINFRWTPSSGPSFVISLVGVILLSFHSDSRYISTYGISRKRGVRKRKTFWIRLQCSSSMSFAFVNGPFCHRYQCALCEYKKDKRPWVCLARVRFFLLGRIRLILLFVANYWTWHQANALKELSPASLLWYKDMLAHGY